MGQIYKKITARLTHEQLANLHDGAEFYGYSFIFFIRETLRLGLKHNRTLIYLFQILTKNQLHQIAGALGLPEHKGLSKNRLVNELVDHLDKIIPDYEPYGDEISIESIERRQA